MIRASRLVALATFALVTLASAVFVAAGSAPAAADDPPPRYP
jgi:hypothetical protein